MWTKIIIVVAILVAEAGMGYYSFEVNGSLFSRFLFFVLSAGIICLIVIKSIRFILPSEDEYSDNKKKSTKNPS